MTEPKRTDDDRTLLERAARAASLRGVVTDLTPSGELTFRVLPGDGTFAYWNPLTDDGDALRLAVKLGMQVGPNRASREPMVFAWARERGMCAEYVAVGGADPYAATRRAIVRAAAAMAKDET